VKIEGRLLVLDMLIGRKRFYCGKSFISQEHFIESGMIFQTLTTYNRHPSSKKVPDPF